MKTKYAILICTFIVACLSSCFAASNFEVVNYGAIADGKTINTKSIQRAIDDCNAKGGGQVMFPSGVFVTGTIILKSNVTLYLSQNAVLKGSPAISDYPDFATNVDTRIENIIGATKKQLIFAENANNIGITGEGTFHPNGEAFQDHIDESPNRPYGLRFVSCNYVTVSNIHMRNSAYWMQRYLHCDHLRLTGLKIWNHCNLNNDGMDIDGCHDVTISDCFVESSDDGICLKSEGNRSCEDVVVNNCIVSSFASGLKLGTGSLGGFKRISFSNCIVRPTKAKIKSHTTGSWGGLAGIDILEVDGALTEFVSFTNIIIDSSDCPIFIKLGNRNGKTHKEDATFKKSGLKNISLSNIQIKNAGPTSSAITGFPGSYVENVSLSNIFIHTRGEGTNRDTSLKIIENSSSYPVSSMFASNLPAYGLYMRHVKNIQLNNIVFQTEKNEQRPVLVLDDVRSASINLLTGDSNSNAFAKIVSSESVNIQSTIDLKKWLVMDNSREILWNNQKLQKTIFLSSNTVRNVKIPPSDSGQVLHLTFENIKIPTTVGKVGKAALFSKGFSLNLGNEPQFNLQSDVSVSFWMKLQQPEADKYYRIFSKRKSWNDPFGYEFEINPALKRINFSGGNMSVKDQGLIEIAFDAEWHYYTATIADRRLRVFMDGKLIGWDDYVAMPNGSEAPLVIGANSAGGDNFEGALDELKIWNRALSTQEIQNLFYRFK